jgi:hypothetical protein
MASCFSPENYTADVQEDLWNGVEWFSGFVSVDQVREDRGP